MGYAIWKNIFEYVQTAKAMVIQHSLIRPFTV